MVVSTTLLCVRDSGLPHILVLAFRGALSARARCFFCALLCARFSSRRWSTCAAQKGFPPPPRQSFSGKNFQKGKKEGRRSCDVGVVYVAGQVDSSVESLSLYDDVCVTAQGVFASPLAPRPLLCESVVERTNEGMLERKDGYLADPEFLPVAPLLLRLLELVLAVGEAGFLLRRPVWGGVGGQMTRRVGRRWSAGE